MENLTAPNPTETLAAALQLLKLVFRKYFRIFANKGENNHESINNYP